MDIVGEQHAILCGRVVELVFIASPKAIGVARGQDIVALRPKPIGQEKIDAFI